VGRRPTGCLSSTPDPLGQQVEQTPACHARLARDLCAQTSGGAPRRPSRIQPISGLSLVGTGTFSPIRFMRTGLIAVGASKAQGLGPEQHYGRG